MEKEFTGLVEESMLTCNTIKMPVNAGGYNISGKSTPSIKFMFEKKPNWFHRFFTRLFLGWVWENEK